MYEGVSASRDLVAVKLEPRDSSHASLDFECEVYVTLHYARVRGVSEMLHYGQHGSFNALVLRYLGPSLEDLRRAVAGALPVQFVMEAAIGVLHSLEGVHDVGYVHGDVKPGNVLTERTGGNRFYLADFGNASRYLDKKGRHVRYVRGKRFSGSVAFASRNMHEGGRLSRRDDLESLGYMMVFLMKGLPWRGVERGKGVKGVWKVGEMKCAMNVEELCKGLPREVKRFVKEVRRLEFEERPQYDMLRQLLNKGLRRSKGGGFAQRVWRR